MCYSHSKDENLAQAQGVQPLGFVRCCKLSLAFLAAALLASLLGCEATSPPTQYPAMLTGQTMGTTYSIKFWHVDRQHSNELFQQSLQAGIERLLNKINQQMSTYLPDSELSRFNAAEFNAAESDAWFSVSPETAFVVQQALHFYQLTDGASDVTVGPLLRLWGFGPQLESSATSAQEPTASAIEKVLDRTGCQYLEVRLDPPALRKTKVGLEVDLSSIAKGYAVDAVAELLGEQGISHFMVEIGGEVRAAGRRADGRAWRIGIESPLPGQRKMQRIVALQDSALATSGDYRSFRRAGGKTYCHVIDPQSGRALPYRGVAVTVLAKTCLEADALATALLVMGFEKGYPWCEAHNVAAMFLSRKEGGTTQHTTSQFPSE